MDKYSTDFMLCLIACLVVITLYNTFELRNIYTNAKTCQAIDVTDFLKEERKGKEFK